MESLNLTLKYDPRSKTSLVWTKAAFPDKTLRPKLNLFRNTAMVLVPQDQNSSLGHN